MVGLAVCQFVSTDIFDWGNRSRTSKFLAFLVTSTGKGYSFKSQLPNDARLRNAYNMSRDLFHKITNHLPRGHETSDHINIQSSLNRSTILNNVQVGLTKILKQLKEAVLLFFKSKTFLFYYYIVTRTNNNKKNMGEENGSGSVLRSSRVKP